MSQIEELQGRILAAMERISSGVERAVSAGAEVAAPDADLSNALEEEKLANAQLEERLRSLKEKHRAEIAGLEAQAPAAPIEEAPDTGRIAELESQLSDVTAARDEPTEKLEESARALQEAGDLSEKLNSLDDELQRLRQTNDQLRSANAALREANEAGIGDPDLINKAMLAELEGLRATRAADAAEVGAGMNKLNTLLSQARDLPEGEEV